MQIRYPRPLQRGDRIGVTAPSSGVSDALRPRLDFAVSFLEKRGFEVVVGECIRADRYISAPREHRAAELMDMLTDPSIRAVVPPWGGEVAIDLLDLLDFDAIAAAEPTWVVGFSDTTTWMLPLTLITGVATMHGTNFMDTPYTAPAPLRRWWDIAALREGESVTQGPPGRHRSTGWDAWEQDPTVTEMTLDAEGSWWSLDGSPVDATGRLIGGCIDVISQIKGTPYGDIPAFGTDHADDGLLVYLEAAGDESYRIARALHGMRLAGWFEHANAILIGRTKAPGHDDLSQADAVRDALGSLGIPIVMDVECGHVQPFLPIINGALGHVVVDGDRRELTQTLS